MNAPESITAPVHAPEVAEALEAAISAVARLQRAYGNDPEALTVSIIVSALKSRRTPETVARLEAARMERVRAG